MPDEILVVDNRPSSAASQDLVRDEFPAVRYVREEAPGIGHARQRALLEAHCEILAFLDDDAVAAADWGAAIHAAQTAPERPAACMGRVLPLALDAPAQRLFEANGGFDRGMDRKLLSADRRSRGFRLPLIVGAVSLGNSCNMALDRAAALAVGGFDGLFGASPQLPGGEDLDLIWRLVDAGHLVTYEPAIRASHEHRAEMAALSAQLANHQRNLLAVLYKAAGSGVAHRRPGIWLFLCWRMLKPGQRLLLRLLGRDPLPASVLLGMWSAALGAPRALRRARRDALRSPAEAPGATLMENEARDCYAKVVNLDFGAEPASSAALACGGRKYVIFWDDERPVAHLWVGPDEDALQRVRQFLAGFQLPVRHRPARAAPATVSIVICTRDRADELARCLPGLQQQTRVPDEIIVVDNASRDSRTRQVAVAAGVTYVREDRPGLDMARNTGVLAAKGEIVAFTDDDTVPDPRWLENLSAAFDREDVVAATGLVLPARLDTEAQWLFERYWGFGRGYERIDFDQAFYVASRSKGCPAWVVGAGANMAFRRTIFDRIGLFDERLGAGAAGCSDDSECWYRVLAAGYTCRYEPTAVVHHHHRLSMDGLKSQIYHYMRGHVAALMVQYERTGDLGNLRRAFIVMPAHYARCVAGRLRRPGSEAQLLSQQIRGSLAGLVYYLRAPKPRR